MTQKVVCDNWTVYHIVGLGITVCTILILHTDAQALDDRDEELYESILQPNFEVPLQEGRLSRRSTRQEEQLNDHLFNGAFGALSERQWTFQEQYGEDIEQEPARQLRKENRLRQIQGQILHKLDMDQVPEGKSMAQLDEESQKRIHTLYQSMVSEVGEERELYPEKDVGVNTLHVVPPSGLAPRRSEHHWFSDGRTDSRRLYFDLLAKDHGLTRKRRRREVVKAGLALYKIRQDCLEELHRKQNKRKCNDRCVRRMRRLERQCPAATDEFHLTAYRYVKPYRNSKKAKKTIIATMTVHAAYFGWVKLDFTSAVQHWFEHRKKNYGIELTVEDKNGDLIDPSELFVLTNCTNNVTKPFSSITNSTVKSNLPLELRETCPALEIQTTLTSRSEADARARRNARFSASFWRKTRCTVEKFYVSVSELGWDNWIVQPHGIEYSVCRGTCLRPPKPNYFERKIAPGEKKEYRPIKHACCGPTKVKPLVIIHFDIHGNLTTSKFNDFLISECGCQV